jgi:putative transposase
MKHKRSSIRLKGYDYSQTGAYFVTVCVQDKRCLLGNVEDDGVVLSPVGKFVYQCLNQIPDHFDSAELDEVVIMPNHIHVIFIINNDNVGAIHELPLQKQRRKMLIPKIVGWFKMNSAKRANLILQKTGQRFWQRNYYEHIIRKDGELNRIREYILHNPIQWKYDRENPDHIPCQTANDNWNQIEEIIYGKPT